MYKNLKSVAFIGGLRTGKSTLINKYIKEVIKEENNIIIIDPKQIEFFSYAQDDEVIYINDNYYEQLNNTIDSLNNSKKTYIFVDEYADIHDNKTKILINDLLNNKHDLNLEFIIATQIKESIEEEILNKFDNVYYLNNINDSNLIMLSYEKDI